MVYSERANLKPWPFGIVTAIRQLIPNPDALTTAELKQAESEVMQVATLLTVLIREREYPGEKLHD